MAAIVAAVSLFAAPVVYAQGEHARRIAAELLIIASDLRLLQKGKVTDQHASGLRKRILGAMAPLDILARLADQEAGKKAVSHHSRVIAMRKDVNGNQLTEAARAIGALLDEYPLVLPDIKIGDTTEFSTLHQSLCAACHDNPDQAVERPAYNLFEQSAATQELEMFARMLTGVRGDNVTGIDNPFSDRQIMGLLAYYRGAR